MQEGHTPGPKSKKQNSALSQRTDIVSLGNYKLKWQAR